MNKEPSRLRGFDIPLGEHLLSETMVRTRHLWRWLGKMESRVLSEEIGKLTIRRPVYVAGLARAGTTILLEVLAAHPDVATHRYQDFWSIHTPVWSEQTRRRMPAKDAVPTERSHGDGILVTPDSPEAIEEMLWMEFFPGLHDPMRSNVLASDASNLPFEQYYRDHIRKLLFVRQRTRYACKANYHVTRMEYLLKLFPEARFILPIRHPREHIASLRKQHALLCEAAARYPRALRYLDRVGHFEFGPHRTPINAGSTESIRQILDLWAAGQEVRGWARYWSHIYRFLADRLEEHSPLRDATLVVRYEDLCADAEGQLTQLLDHGRLIDSVGLADHFGSRIAAAQLLLPKFLRRRRTGHRGRNERGCPALGLRCEFPNNFS